MSTPIQRSPLKWAGGKADLIEEIRRILPPGKRLVEPFVGGGSVFLNTDYPEYVLVDRNVYLINFYRQLEKNRGKFIDYCAQFFVPEYNNADQFYALRSTFNSTFNSLIAAALFLYLNRHCFNGLCRFNDKGEFNTSFGSYAKPYFPRREMLAFLRKLDSCKVTIRHDDFRDTFDLVEAGDVVYCDPVYVPLSVTANFTSYTAGGFGWDRQVDLVKLAQIAAGKGATVQIAAGKGATVAISNHDTPLTRQLYAEAAEIHELQVQRNISCKGSGRGKVAELIAVYR